MTSEWWAAITHRFQAHVREETRFLEKYEQAIRDVACDPGTRALLERIVEDERRHHDHFEQLASASRGEGGTIPPPPAPDRATAESLLDATREFLDAERHDQRELRRLRKELEPLADASQWPLIVHLMEIDTAKHIAILEYLERHLRRAVRD
jgi:rubrerythrin